VVLKQPDNQRCDLLGGRAFSDGSRFFVFPLRQQTIGAADPSSAVGRLVTVLSSVEAAG
jgi:hypothetical protein